MTVAIAVMVSFISALAALTLTVEVRERNRDYSEPVWRSDAFNTDPTQQEYPVENQDRDVENAARLKGRNV